MLRTHKKFFLSLLGFVLLIAGGIFLFFQTQVARETTSATAKITLVPAELSLAVGKEADLSIEIDTDGEAVNTVTANLSYPAEILELVNLSLQDSFAKIWFEKEVSVPGIVKLTGSLPTPGFSGKGTFAKVSFHTKAKGEAKINFSSDSAVFRNIDSIDILGQTEGNLLNVR